MAQLGDLYFDINFRTANAEEVVKRLTRQIEGLGNTGVNQRQAGTVDKVTKAMQRYVNSNTEAGKQIAFANKMTSNQNKLWQQQLAILNSSKGSIDQYTARLNYLKTIYSSLGSTERYGRQGRAINGRIAQLQRELDLIKSNSAAWNQNTAARNANAAASTMAPTIQGLMKQNSILTSLANMAKNYVGVFGAVSFFRSLVRISGEFEYQYRALQSIMQSAGHAKELFAQLQGLAIESPYRFQELLGFSKQLSAFQVPNRELFDTTKRLADIASGVGVDMQRIILAYGQVRAASVLRGQELRQFTEAGIPMVRALADEFTRLEGHVVSTGDVFKRISEREVPFEMVKKVLMDLTKEGGKFYNHQFKQAQTLKGKVEKLADAYQIMLYQIGNSGVGNRIKDVLDFITRALSDWRETLLWIGKAVAVLSARKLIGVSRAIKMGSAASVKSAYMMEKRANAEEAMVTRPRSDFRMGSIYRDYYRNSGIMRREDWVDLAKRTQAEVKLTDAQVGRLFVMGKLKKADMDAIGLARGWSQEQINVYKNMSLGARSAKALTLSLGGAANAFKTLWASVWPVLAITAIIDTLVYAFGDAATDITQSFRSQFSNLRDDLEKFMKDYADIINNLNSQGVVITFDEEQKIWETFREKIESLEGGDIEISILSQIKEMRERNKLAANYLDNMRRLAVVMNNITATLKVHDNEGPFGILENGLDKDALDYLKALQKFKETPTDSSLKDKAVSELSELDNELRRLATQIVPIYNEAIAKGFNTPELLNALLKNLETSVKDAAPNMVDSIIQEFEALWVNEYLTSGDALKMPENYPETLFKGFVEEMRNYAESQNIDLNKAILDGDEELIKKIANGAINNAHYVSGSVLSIYKNLRDNIMRNEIIMRIRVTMGLDKIESKSSFLDTLYGSEKERKKKIPNPKITGNTVPELQKSYEEQKKKLLLDNAFRENENKSLDRNTRLTKEQKARRDANSKAIADNNKSLEQLEIERKDYNLTYSKTGDPKAEAKGAKDAAAAQRRAAAEANKAENARVKAIKREYEEKKAAVESFNKFVVLIGKEESKRLFNDRNKNGESAFSGDELAKYAGKDELALIDEMMNRLSKDTTEAGKNFYSELSKKRGEIADKTALDKVQREIDALKEMLKLDKEAWSLYEKLLEQTNDEAMASLALLNGRAANKLTGEKYYNSYRDELLKSIEAGLEKSGITIKVSDFISVDEKDLANLFRDNDIAEPLQEKIKEYRETSNELWKNMLSTFAGYAENLMTADDKIKRIENNFAKQREDFVNLLKERYAKELDGTKINVSGIEIDIFDALKNADTEDAVDAVFDMLGDRIPEGFKALRNVFKNNANEMSRQISEIMSESLRASKAWEWLFSELEGKTVDMLKRRKSVIDEAISGAVRQANGKYKLTIGGTTYTDVTEKDLAKLREQSKKTGKAIAKYNPFTELKKAFDEYVKAKRAYDANPTIENAMNMEDAWERLTNSIAAAREMLKQFGELGGAIAKAFGASADSIEVFTGMLDKIGGLVLAIKTKDIGGIISNVTGILSTIVSLFDNHDEHLDDMIRRSQEKATKIMNIYDEIGRQIERSLGGAYTMRGDTSVLDPLTKQYKTLEDILDAGYDLSEAYYVATKGQLENFDEIFGNMVKGGGGVYKAQLALLKARRAEVDEQMRMEEGKKDTDQSAIEDYRKDLADLDDQIRYFAEDTLKELMSIDLKDWASQISESLVDAFAAGEDAAKAFDKTVADLMKNVVKQMVSLYVIEPALENLRNYLFGENGTGGAFGSDYELTANEIPGLLAELMQVKERIGDANELFDTINEALRQVGIDLTNESGEGTLGKGIQSITESTADLLASYLNAIRADVSVLRMRAEMSDDINSPLAQMQIQQMNSIIANTLRNAEAAERIETALNSVIAVGATGKKLRV